jgi:TolA-binding protein
MAKASEKLREAQSKIETIDLDGFKGLKVDVDGLKALKGNLDSLKDLKDLKDLDGFKYASRDLAELKGLTGLNAMKLGLDMDLAGVKMNLSLLEKNGLAFQVRGRSGDGNYDSGARLLDERKYDEAILRFNSVIDGKGPRADGAMYWRAYALNRLGRRDEALAAIAALRRDYPQSHWLNDAQALESEVKQGAGQGVSPADETNEDLKLMAINSLMNADPERAIPLLENLLKGGSTPKVKDRAMFVLTQSRSPRAGQILTDYAKGAGNPDLQLRAIRYIGMSSTPEAQQQLSAIYSASSDASVKRDVLRALMVSRAKDQVFNLAKTEKDPELRLEAIRQLGAMRATDQLSQLFASESSPENRVQIVRSMAAAGAFDKLMEIAKNEKDQKVRGEAIRTVAMSHMTTPDTIEQLYAADPDPKTKRDLINGLHARGDAKPLIDLAKKESDPTMKKYIVERLSVMHSKEATDYMLELLK